MSLAVPRPLSGLRDIRNLVPVGRIALGVACIVVWQLGSNAMGSEWLPGPLQVVVRIWQLAVSGELARDTLVTFSEAAAGMIIGGTAGAVLPFILRLSPRLMTALEPLISAGFGLPKLALAPLFILWFGIGITTKVVFVASIVFFLIFYNGL
ncbi:MAG: ABC transporter permease, partial [Xanthobacteraceae bacterium]